MEKRQVGYEIKTLSNLLKRRMDSHETSEGETGMTGVQCRILGFLSHNQDREIFQRDIEAEFMIRRSTVTGILQGMEKNGLIYRQPVARDARLKQLKLTEKSIAATHRIEKKIDAMEERLTRGISEEEMAVFYSVTDRMKKNLQD